MGGLISNFIETHSHAVVALELATYGAWGGNVPVITIKLNRQIIMGSNYIRTTIK